METAAPQSPSEKWRGLGDPRLALTEAKLAEGRDLDLLPLAEAAAWARVRSTIEAAAAVLRPTNPFAHGPAHYAGLVLAWEAVALAFAARGEPTDEGDLSAQIAALPDDSLAPTTRTRVTAVPARHLPTDPAEQLSLADALLDVARSLERAATARSSHDHTWIRRRTLLRLVLAITAVLTVFTVGRAGYRAIRGPDLAVGKPFRTSSKYANLNVAEGMCDGRSTKIFFHTREEDEPWYELDLGRPTPMRRVVLTNRGDELSDRAAPLVIEIGDDQKTWRKVAEQATDFRHWSAPVDSTARYVRVRATHRTFLHLEKVEVF